MYKKACFVLSATLLGLPCILQAAVPSITTWHNDNSRTGVNSSESILNIKNVNASSFGKLYSLPVDGQIYAQPLYVPSVSIPSGPYEGTHNVLYVATAHDTVYAFDADASTPLILWSTSLGVAVPCSVYTPGDSSCSGINFNPEVGIVSTPVIDPTNNSIYVVAETLAVSQIEFTLHSLNIATGAENANSPVVISGQVPGNGSGSVNGTLVFDPNWHWQRTGLTLLRGNIYFGFGSIGDVGPWHGWLFGYHEAGLAQIVIKCFSPNLRGNAVWQGGAAFPTDNASNLYIQTGNGSFNASAGGTEWGESLIKMNAVTNSFTSYFTPSNESNMDLLDNDLGAAGTLILPAASPLIAPMIIGGGKDGRFFLLNTANLKGYNPVDQVVQEFQSLTSPYPTSLSQHYGGNVFYNNALYSWGSGDVLKRWAFTGSSFSKSPVSTGSYQAYLFYTAGPAMSLSANGTVSGSAILWAATPAGTPGVGTAAVLRAYDADNVGTELWDSTTRGSVDAAGSWSKWVPPTVANGKVYLATLDGRIDVYGLLTK